MLHSFQEKKFLLINILFVQLKGDYVLISQSVYMLPVPSKASGDVGCCPFLVGPTNISSSCGLPNCTPEDGPAIQAECEGLTVPGTVPYIASSGRGDEAGVPCASVVSTGDVGADRVVLSVSPPSPGKNKANLLISTQ